MMDDGSKSSDHAVKKSRRITKSAKMTEEEPKPKKKVVRKLKKDESSDELDVESEKGLNLSLDDDESDKITKNMSVKA